MWRAVRTAKEFELHGSRSFGAPCMPGVGCVVPGAGGYSAGVHTVGYDPFIKSRLASSD